MDESILGIDDGTVARRVHQGFHPFFLFKTGGDDFLAGWQGLDNTLYVLVAFEIFDREEAGRILVADAAVTLDELLDPGDALLQLGAVVDVNVAAERRLLTLVDMDKCVEEAVDALARTAHRRHQRHPQQLAEALGVELVAPLAELVIHIQRHHYAQVHIYQLCR